DRVSEVIDAAGRSTRFGYHEVPYYNNNLADKTATACFEDTPLSIVEKTGPIVIDFRKYPHQRNLASIEYPHSSTPTLNTHNTDRVVSQTTSSGETWQFSYRRVGACVVKVADEAAKTWAYSCRAGQPLSTAKPGNASGTQTLSGLCPEIDSEETRAQGWRFYGGHNAETVVTRPDGSSLRQRYDAKGMVIDETDSAGQRTQRQYDAESRLLSTTDPLGRSTKHEYDANGNKAATTNALGHRVETAFDPSHNQPTRQTRYLLGAPSQQGGLQLSYTPLDTTFTLDAKGQLTQVIDPTGLGTQMGYDAKGQLSSVTLPARSTASTLPVVSEGTAGSIAKAARQIALSYNAAGDLSKITDALNNATQLNTDTLGRTTSSTDPLGYTSTQSYNTIDQPTGAKNPLNHTTRFTYDAAGRTTGVVNEAGVTIESYTHDSQGRVTQVKDALNQTTSIEYDTSNRPNKITDRKGQVTQISYTERGQISSISQPGQTIQYQYDAVGRLTEVRDNTSVNQYWYDAADRVTQIDSTTAAGSHRLGYEYDSLDRITKRNLSGTGITTPETTSYSWDLAGRLLSHSTNIGSTPHKTEYEYDQAGRLAARHAQAGSQGKVTQRYGYDQAERLAQIKYLRNEGQSGEQLIEQIDYQYDAKGQRTGKTTLNNHGAGGQETPMTATYDAANRMSAVTLTIGGQSESYTLTHDANGNLTTKQNTADSQDKTTYTWDSNNRLTQITQPGLTASFTYDAFGRRIQSSITKGGSTSTVQYLYEGLQSLGEIRDGKLSHRLLTGLSLDETIARIAVNTSGNKDAATSRIYMTDALNSVIAQLNDDDSATVANSYAYSPYGESQTIGPDATGNPIQYTSRENDGSGLIYHRGRYRNPVLGGWLSEDPAGFVDGFNKRAYVRGDPMSLADPTGEYGIGGFIGGAAFNAGMQFAVNYAQTGDWKRSMRCINLADVVISGAIGAIGPSLLGNVILGKNGPYGYSRGIDALFWATRSLPAGFALKKAAPDFRIGTDCECDGLSLGGAVGELVH
ncbi:MAG: RHS repeat-associated core domain-containing protein, partial [Hydrogenophaga sp.]|uniref:RHS repeat-associated core domain-containing protein n=1 Tax=Hydrogenophaga sp. TaxID=1904254 RepID=UPI002733DC36